MANRVSEFITRNEKASNVTKIILTAWLVVVAWNADTIFSKSEAVPVKPDLLVEPSDSLETGPNAQTSSGTDHLEPTS